MKVIRMVFLSLYMMLVLFSEMHLKDICQPNEIETVTFFSFYMTATPCIETVLNESYILIRS